MSSAGRTFIDYPVVILSPIFLPKMKETIQFNSSMANFRRLMKLHPTSQLLNFPCREVLHSLAGLYDVALPCMDLNTIYASILDCKAVSIYVVDSSKHVANRLFQKFRKHKLKKKIDYMSKYDELIDKNLSDLKNSESDTYCVKSGEVKCKTVFNYVYSDSESDDENNSDGENVSADSDYEMYTNGYKTFLISSLKRKKLQHEEFQAKKSVSLEHIGFEDLLLGGTTYEICHVEGKRILHLTFIAVQKYFRGSGLGTALLNSIKNRDISGDYKAIVVHADPGAVEFFKRNGFSDDYVINSQWNTFAAEYTNCTLMTFYPSFSDPEYIMVDKSGQKEILLMEELQSEWQRQSQSVHCNQAALFHRMHQEITELRKAVASQDAITKQLMSELRKVSRERDKIKNQLHISSHSVSQQVQCDENTKSPRRPKLPSIGENQKTLFGSQVGPDGDKTDRDLIREIKAKFEKSLTAIKLTSLVKITQVTPSFLSSKCRDRFVNFQQTVPSSPPVRLYYIQEQMLCPKRYCEILHKGFSDDDRVIYLQTKGFLLSTLPHISYSDNSKHTFGRLILVDVILGTSFMESNLKDDQSIDLQQYNSIILSSTLSSSKKFDPVNLQYLAKSSDQLSPVAMIEYIIT